MSMATELPAISVTGLCDVIRQTGLTKRGGGGGGGEGGGHNHTTLPTRIRQPTKDERTQQTNQQTNKLRSKHIHICHAMSHINSGATAATQSVERAESNK